MSQEEEQKDGSESGDVDDLPRASGPLGKVFPVDQAVWTEARRLIADKNSRIDNIATIAIQDPVLVMEFIRRSNALFFTGGGNPITSVKTALVRLGSDVVLETLEKLKERETINEPEIKLWFEHYRAKCRRAGIIARLFAESIARQLADDTQVVGSLTYTGDMLAVINFGEEYLKLAADQSRSGVNYRLAQNHRFDVERMGMTYLKRYGIPDVLTFALDREGRTRDNQRAIIKPICQSAVELIEAFDNNRWEKLAPGKKLAPKSALRMLQLSDTQYLKIYERASEYLFSAKLLEEKKKNSAPAAEEEAPAEEVVRPSEEKKSDGLQDEIDSLLSTPKQEEPVAKPETEAPTKIEQVEEEIPGDDFSLQKAKTPKAEARVSAPQVKSIEPPRLRTSGGTAFVGDVVEMFEEADNSEELLQALLQKLVDGPFHKSALIVVSKDRKRAMVVAARGPNIGNGQKLELKDPLSPLAQCFSKVQSFSSRANEASPFGSKSFAVSPIDADHDTPVALYADCGENGALTFEARRVFRTVVEILNQKLPTIPGGIPNEL